MSWNNTTTASGVCVQVDIFPLFVFAFVVNVLALIAVSKAKPRGRAYNATQQIHMLIFCLSLSDTTSVALQCIMPVTSFINCGWFGGKASCNVFGYISAVLVVWSAWIVVYLSFQRFLVTVYPFRYRNYFTTKKIAYLLISGFIVQCGFFAPPFLGVGEFVYYETGQFCSLSLTPTGKTDTIYLGAIVAQGFLCVALTIISNISVVISLESRKSNFSGLTLYSLQSSTSTFMSLTKAVAVMFCLCYIPFLVSYNKTFLQFYNPVFIFLAFLKSWNLEGVRLILPIYSHRLRYIHFEEVDIYRFHFQSTLDLALEMSSPARHNSDELEKNYYV